MSSTAPASTPAITAVLVSYDESPEQLRLAVDSLLAQTRAPAQVLIIDNSPGGSAAQGLRGYADAVRVIESGSNLGGGRLRRAARGGRAARRGGRLGRVLPYPPRGLHRPRRLRR